MRQSFENAQESSRAREYVISRASRPKRKRSGEKYVRFTCVLCIALKTPCKGRGFSFQGVAFSPQKPGAFRTNQGRGQNLGVAFQLNKAKKTSKQHVFWKKRNLFRLREGLLRNRPLPSYRGRLSFSPVRALFM